MTTLIVPESNSPPASADQARRLECLLDAARVINSSLELGVVLDQILQGAQGVLSAESASIMLLDAEGHALTVVAALGPRADRIRGHSQTLDEGVAGWVVRERRPLLLRGATDEPRFRRLFSRQDIRDALCVPLHDEARVLGVISLNNRLGDGPFTGADLALLTALSHHAALAIRNAWAFEQIREQRRTLERLLGELTHAQEEERRRIALQMHDGPAQTMFAALRQLEAARAYGAGTPGPLPEALDGLEQTLRAAIGETRAVMVDLRPLCLDDVGLFAALRAYGERFEQRTGIRTEVVRRGSDRRLDARREAMLYRIAQEALTNVWKHAGAHSAQVILDLRRGGCVLEVQDDGRGFCPEEAAEREADHLGLRSLRERAELLGGRLSILPGAPTGTVVRVEVRE